LGQAEVLEYLEKHKRWVYTTELTEKLRVCRKNVTNSAKRLVEQNEIEVKNDGGWHRENKYRIKQWK
jgi:DNA-binding MarR family transcriptional regulator